MCLQQNDDIISIIAVINMAKSIIFNNINVCLQRNVTEINVKL
jgi:hypothetical protein